VASDHALVAKALAALSTACAAAGERSVIVVRVTKEFFNTSNLNLKLFSHIKRLAIMSFG
jgi:hypothetical protein